MPLQRCMATHSNANVALMRGKLKVLVSDLRKLQDYVISEYHILSYCIKVGFHNRPRTRDQSFFNFLFMFCKY
jgi:hypothetical protein